MGRVVQVPYVYRDEQRDRSFYLRRFPKDVTPLTGQWFQHKYPSSWPHKQAERESRKEAAEFNAMVDAARERLGTLDGMFEARHALQQSRSKRLCGIWEGIAAVNSVLGRVDGVVERVRNEAALIRFAAERGIALTIPEAKVQKPIDPEEVIDAWIAERHAIHKPPEKKAITAKRSALADLFGFAKTSDIKRIDEPVMRAYRLHLLKLDQQDGTQKARHLLGDIKALFKAAKAAGFITTNPAKDLPVPPKSDKVSQPLDDDEARRILEKARQSPDPALRWPHWIAAFSTGHNKEILRAHSSEFYPIKAGPFAGQWVWDMRGRQLKTDARPRILALHPALIREGFLDYLRTRQCKPLFSGSYSRNDSKLNELITSLKPTIDKRFYSWRKRNAHKLAKLAGPELGRYLSGHTAKDIAEKYYRFHELPDEFGDIVKAINGLENPSSNDAP